MDKVWVTDDDSAYLDAEGMTREQVTGSELRNLTNREIMADLLFIRSTHWVMRAEKSRSKSWVDLSRAFHLAPDDPAIAKTYQGIFGQYRIKPEHTLADIRAIESAVLRNEANAALMREQRWMLPPPQGKIAHTTVDGGQPNATLVPANGWNRVQPGAIAAPASVPNNVLKGIGNE